MVEYRKSYVMQMLDYRKRLIMTTYSKPEMNIKTSGSEIISDGHYDVLVVHDESMA